MIRIRCGLEGGIGAPIKVVRELTFPFCSHQSKNKRGSHQSATQKRASTKNQPCLHPDLRLPASKTVRNTFLLFIMHPACGILSEPPEKQRQKKLEADIRTTLFITYCLFYRFPYASHGNKTNCTEFYFIVFIQIFSNSPCVVYVC